MPIGGEEKIPEIIGLSGSSYILFKISSKWLKEILSTTECVRIQ